MRAALQAAAEAVETTRRVAVAGAALGEATEMEMASTDRGIAKPLLPRPPSRQTVAQVFRDRVARLASSWRPQAQEALWDAVMDRKAPL